MELIQIITRDKVFTVPKQIMMKNDFLKALLNKECIDDKLYINISSTIFDRIIEYLTYDELEVYEPTNEYSINELKRYFDMYLLDWDNVTIVKSKSQILHEKIMEDKVRKIEERRVQQDIQNILQENSEELFNTALDSIRKLDDISTSISEGNNDPNQILQNISALNLESIVREKNRYITVNIMEVLKELHDNVNTNDTLRSNNALMEKLNTLIPQEY